MNKYKKILITGGAGYIGRYLTDALVKKGYSVTVADRNIAKKVGKIKKGIKYVETDLCEFQNALSCMKGMEICIHLAATLGGVNYLNSNPAKIITQNSLINSAVFRAAEKQSIKRIIYVSSGMVFENNPKNILKESDLMSTPIPFSAYSFSKLEGEMLCHAFYKESGLSFSIVRLFNVYGPIAGKQKSKPGTGHIIPEFTDRILNNENPLKIIGNGKQTRSFTFIDDAVSGIVRIVEEDKYINTDFNISSNEQVNILNLAKLIWKISGKSGKLSFIHINNSRSGDTRVPSIQKAAKLLNWRTKISLKKGLAKIVEDRKKQIQLNSK